MPQERSNPLEKLVAPGTVVAGKYRVERVIGEGGMGVVVEAWHLDFEERVAIKFLSPDLCTNQEAVARFEREARVLFKIKSPHVCRVLDVGRLAAGSPYLVLEYLEGEDLAARLTHRQPSRLEDAVSWVVEACDAVSEAHARGIVHRDIKPENLFLARGPDGRPRVKVLDFGLSKIASSKTAERQRALTATEQSMGTPHYMSPEQWVSARDVGPASDQWALAVILYELLTGLPPFDGEQLAQVCSAVLHASLPPIRERLPGIPSEIEAALERALRKEPPARYPNLGEFAAALAPFGRSESRAIADRVRRMFEQADALLRSAEMARLPMASVAAVLPASEAARREALAVEPPPSVPAAFVPPPASSVRGAPAIASSGSADAVPRTSSMNETIPAELPIRARLPFPPAEPSNPGGTFASAAGFVPASGGVELAPLSGSMVGGSVDGGSVDGGSVVGGSVDGGSVDGGSVDGGSVDGGSVVGGSVVGGSVVGGSVVGIGAVVPATGEALPPGTRRSYQTAQSWQQVGERPSRSRIPSPQRAGLIAFFAALSLLGALGWVVGPRLIDGLRAPASIAPPPPSAEITATSSPARPALSLLSASSPPGGSAAPPATAPPASLASPSASAPRPPAPQRGTPPLAPRPTGAVAPRPQGSIFDRR